jgi:aldose 1-epimerase
VDALSFLQVRQIELLSSELRVAVLPEIGGGIGRLDRREGGMPVLRPWDGVRADSNALGCYALLPWSNRISGGGIRVDGRFFELRPNFPGEPFPIHGDGWQKPWTVTLQTGDRLRLALESASQPPFDYCAQIDYALVGATLAIRLAVLHRGLPGVPYGLGFHPWLPRTPGTSLEAPAAEVWLEDEHYLPTRRIGLADRPDWDFCQPRPLPEGWINNGFVRWNGRARIAWPERDLRLDIEATPEFGTYILYSPGAASDFFCFEPVTHAVDAFHLPGGPEAHGLRLLRQGDHLEAGLRLTVGPVA